MEVVLHVDHLGSTRYTTLALEDGVPASGSALTRHKFFPFGEEITPLVDDTTKMFTGHERDSETGLDYMLARYYGSSLGRYLSTDPVSDSVSSAAPQTWNRYSYVRNNPLSRIDPNGETDIYIGCSPMAPPGHWPRPGVAGNSQRDRP
jgi:RHS repeat-associated protein